MDTTPRDRFPPRARDAMSSAELDALDEIVGARGMLPGPASLMLHAPDAARAYDAWSRALWVGALPAHVGELVFLYLARVHRCRYQWINHAGKARKAGITDPLIDALGRDDTPPAGTAGELLETWRFVDELHTRHAVSDGTFNAITARFGVRGAAELAAFCGLAASVALLLNVRQPPLPEAGSAPF